MKKPYQVPYALSVRLRAEAPFLTTSNIPIGGSTDHFDSNQREEPSGWEGWSQEDEE
ncbi:MAG: hypothetical protein PUB53_05265 [Bacteroidales bacterium]|nr:hypothetical protein [Bacteroidales bacterium]